MSGLRSADAGPLPGGRRLSFRYTFLKTSMLSAHRALRALAVSALLAVLAIPAAATDLHNVLADYSITSWSKKDGLPPGTIWALAQDDDGYLWIGADFGLVRFDGVRFVPWDAIGHAPLPKFPVQALRASRDGSLWVGFGND